jgi:uncharacterized membrane protein YidH (DUF202 family)
MAEDCHDDTDDAEDEPSYKVSKLPFLLFLAFLAVAISVTILGVAVAAIGAGLLFDRIFGLGATNGTWIILGAAGVVALFIGIVIISVMLGRIREEGVPVRWDSEDEDELPEELVMRLVKKLKPDSGRRSWGSFRRARRAPCPCGSGKKFAECCGDKAVE